MSLSGSLEMCVSICDWGSHRYFKAEKRPRGSLVAVTGTFKYRCLSATAEVSVSKRLQLRSCCLVAVLERGHSKKTASGIRYFPVVD